MHSVAATTAGITTKFGCLGWMTLRSLKMCVVLAAQEQQATTELDAYQSQTDYFQNWNMVARFGKGLMATLAFVPDPGSSEGFGANTAATKCTKKR